MSLLNSLLSSIESGKPVPPLPAKPLPSTAPPQPAPRPVAASNGTPQLQAVKRKAEGPPEGGVAKIPRKDIPAQLARPNSLAPTRPAPTSDATRPKSKSTTPTSTIPYRGTAGGLNAAKAPIPGVKKPSPAANPPATAAKAAAPAPRAAGSAPAAASGPVKKGSYAAILAAAKQREQTKPIAPPIKHEPTKIPTKEERLALRAQAKGKKPNGSAATATAPAKAGAAKVDPKEKRKPAELGYTGTARPAKKPVEISYRGTARPTGPLATAPGKAAGPAAKAKAHPSKARDQNGYLDWDELDEDEEDYGKEEEDFDEDDGYESSDMEAGGFFDLEQEEQRALKAAKAEDAAALAEEMALKRQKEERKRKLAALSKASAGKRRIM